MHGGGRKEFVLVCACLYLGAFLCLLHIFCAFLHRNVSFVNILEKNSKRIFDMNVATFWVRIAWRFLTQNSATHN